MVTREADGYRVSAANGTEHRCRSVVVALPPTLRSRIVFEPTLPDRVTGFCQRAPMGSMIKVLAVYDSAWWRDDGLSGFAQGQLSAVALTADSSPPIGSTRHPGRVRRRLVTTPISNGAIPHGGRSQLAITVQTGRQSGVTTALHSRGSASGSSDGRAQLGY